MVHIQMEVIVDAFIQYQDNSGNWVQIEVVPNESAQIITAMKRVAYQMHPYRVRAVDINGHLLDIL
jgi:hypothetical protein